jgi:hypothetical protein
MYLESKGEVIGPLHGVPICVKVRTRLLANRMRGSDS